MIVSTDQEKYWTGKDGDEYIDRNESDQLFFSKVAMWSNMLGCTNNVTSIMEFGCNIGLNLKALNKLHPNIKLCGIEINAAAAKRASELGIAEITCGTILEELGGHSVDLAFTAGVLIHINPDRLDSVYSNLVKLSRRYVLVAEYYNPSPTSVVYRGHKDRLFKRDFAGDLIQNYGLKLVDYGFVYKRDNWAPQDDITWFLLEK